ncbi:MAG: hypothetical protein KDI09_04410 [Halioglobus sp.]|nr:hypothetical protein [Halioglobus sp.]
MTTSGQANSKLYSISELAEEPLDIEIIKDEDYRRNTIYCSWQEIIAGGSVASPDTAVNAPKLVIATR